ncbi:hypothetical protein KHP62_03040 [Rhodobacteraceae bacterium NNCM2]|nr:hypothetical protein [Coraliihabitans acroporae]
MGARYFVILGAMRTGSNLLENHLAALPDTVTFGEAFNPSFISGPKHEERLGWTVADRDADPIGFLNAMRAAEPGKIAGFRLFDGHSPEVERHVLSDPDCARIILKRDPVESYISLRIAEATGQWLLVDARRRKRARVHFDPVRFDAYRARMDAYYARLESAIAAAGMAAETVEFDALGDLGVLNHLASHIGSTDRLAELEAGILRQNPEPVEAKVENAAEMLAHLGRAPSGQAAPLPEMGDTVHSRNAPLIWNRVPGQEVQLGTGLMNAIEIHGYGASAIPPGRLRTDPMEHFDSGDEGATVGRETVFLMTEAATERLHTLFLLQTFRGKTALPFVIRELDERHGPTGPLRRWLDRIDEPEIRARHRKRLIGFLDMIVEARAGRGMHPVHPGWLPQADYLEAAHAQFGDLHLIRSSHLREDADALVKRLGLTSLPKGALGGVERLLRSRTQLAEAVLTPQIAVKCADLDSRLA